jgi:hypothetical protein
VERDRRVRLGQDLDPAGGDPTGDEVDLVKHVDFSTLFSDKKQISVGFIGYPNVGKSSIINTLKKKAVCKVLRRVRQVLDSDDALQDFLRLRVARRRGYDPGARSTSSGRTASRTGAARRTFCLSSLARRASCTVGFYVSGLAGAAAAVKDLAPPRRARGGAKNSRSGPWSRRCGSLPLRHGATCPPCERAETKSRRRCASESGDVETLWLTFCTVLQDWIRGKIPYYVHGRDGAEVCLSATVQLARLASELRQKVLRAAPVLDGSYPLRRATRSLKKS